MFVVHRTNGEKLVINNEIVIVVSKSKGQIRVGVEAPRSMVISRAELLDPVEVARIERQARTGVKEVRR